MLERVEQVHTYDVIMLIVLGMSALLGAIKGLAWQIASLASIIVSYIVACRYRTQVAGMIDAQPPWNSFLAMLILYVGTGFVIWVGFRLLSGVIDKIRLKSFDRHLGALFGLGKGVIFCLLITMFAMTLLGTKQQAAICQSRSGYYMSAFLDKAVLILPQEVHATIGEYLARLDHQLEQGQQNQFPPDGGSGTFNAPNLSNLTKELGQLLPRDLNQLIPTSNPNSWPNATAQPNNFGRPEAGLGSNGPAFGAGSQQPNGPTNGSNFGGSNFAGSNLGLPNSTFVQPDSNFGNGGNQSFGNSNFGTGAGTGLRPSGGGLGDLPSGIFPR